MFVCHLHATEEVPQMLVRWIFRFQAEQIAYDFHTGLSPGKSFTEQVGHVSSR